VVDTGSAIDSKMFEPYCEMKYADLKVEDLSRKYRSLIDQCAENVPVDAYTIDSVRKLGWTKILDQAISHSFDVVNALSSGRSVLVQSGGSGFETDAVIASLAQIILDPYYRTFDGFCVLLDKEWILQGYKFNSPSHEPFAVLYLFLNCVWELMQLHPLSFGFTEDLLIFFLDNVHSKQFSTFIYDNEKERSAKANGTASLFVFLMNTSNQERFINESTNAQLAASTAKGGALPRSEINPMPWFTTILRWNPWLRHNTRTTKKELKTVLKVLRYSSL